MATTPERAHLALEVARQIRPQVDRLAVYVNGDLKGTKKWPGDWLIHPVGDLAAAGKFYAIPDSGFHLTVDDDLVYPEGYVASLQQACDRHGGVVSYHGSIIPDGLIRSYFRDRIKYPILRTVEADQRVHIAGTGCMGWYPGRQASRPAWGVHMLPPFMVDIHFARWCKRFGVKRTVIAHNEGDFTHREIDIAKTLGGKFYNCDTIHTWYVNQTDWERL